MTSSKSTLVRAISTKARFRKSTKYVLVVVGQSPSSKFVTTPALHKVLFTTRMCTTLERLVVKDCRLTFYPRQENRDSKRLTPSLTFTQMLRMATKPRHCRL